MKHLYFIILLLALTIQTKADNVQFTATAPRVVEVGEQFEIVYTINAEPSGFRPPEFKELSLLGGPSQSRSSSIQFINGKVTQSMSISYSYYFSATKAGTFTFEPAKATVDGKTYLSNSITIEVVGGKKGNVQQTSPGTSSQSTTSSKQPGEEEVVAEAGNDDIFVRILIDKNTVYQGEHIIATIKLYSRLNISSIEKVDYPSFNGFFRQDIETPPLQRLEREVVNGQVYGTGIIQKMVLMPQKAGQITIEPFSLQAIVQIPVSRRPRSIWDDFWGPQVKEVRKKVESKAVTITVKPLPSNPPANFKGAVGNFSFNATLDKNQVKTNDAVTLKITISGNGNLKMIEPFDIKFPSDFETYDPKISVNTKASTNGISGSKTFEYLIIPRHSGTFKISPVEFSWFDTQSKQYKTASSNEFVINVEKGAGDESVAIVQGISKEDVRFIGKDIHFIKIHLRDIRKKGDYIFGSSWFYWTYIISFALFLIIIFALRKYIKSMSDVVAVKSRKANKIANKRLKDAITYLKQSQYQEFYAYLLKALWGYMSDKLVIPVSELSREKIKEKAVIKNISDETIDEFLNIIDTCEFARYAPAQTSGEMHELYKKAIDVISKIEQMYKK